MSKSLFIIALSLFFITPQMGNLTPQTGRLMLQQRMNANAEIYPVDYSFIAAITSEPSFYTPDERSPLEGPTLLRFLKAALVTENVSNANVWDVSGDFDGSFPGGAGPHANECFYLYLTLRATTLPRMDGTYRLEHPRPCAGAGNETSEGTFTAEVVPGDRLLFHEFTPDLHGSTEGEVTINTTNGLSLVGRVWRGGGSEVINVEGKPPLRMKTIKQYTYQFSPSFRGLIQQEGKFIRGGSVKVDRLANLVLVSSVAAQASFYWHVDFNNAARVVTETPQQNGVGSVMFRKQPNGRWVVWSYSLK